MPFKKNEKKSTDDKNTSTIVPESILYIAE